MGAIASGGVRVLNEDIIRRLGITPRMIDAVAQEQQCELERREYAYRRGRKPLDVTGRIVILVDDGLATGASMRAAVQALRKTNPKRIVVAAPVGAAETCEDFRDCYWLARQRGAASCRGAHSAPIRFLFSLPSLWPPGTGASGRGCFPSFSPYGDATSMP